MNQEGPINLQAVAAGLTALWSPQVVAKVNDQFVKVAKVRGDLAWHSHENEDELFLVLSGRLTLEFEDRPAVVLGPGEIHVVPKGVRHNPLADEECLIALVEPTGTRHTGEVVMSKTRSIAEQLGAA